MRSLTINAERLWESLMTMAQIGATPRGGVCRLALTDEDREARDLFVHWAKDAGCTVEIDQIRQTTWLPPHCKAKRQIVDPTTPSIGHFLESQHCLDYCCCCRM
jgi:acetylornithine deacetylase/succinyl-diaminopimelate desuccinylase-like protein